MNIKHRKKGYKIANKNDKESTFKQKRWDSRSLDSYSS